MDWGASLNGNNQLVFTSSDGLGFTSGSVKGNKGDKGDTGNTRNTGNTGSSGSTGATGSTGAIGATGAIGRGLTTPSYISSTGILTLNFSDGLNPFSTTDIRGGVGATGSIGATGATGSIGATGTNGATGATGLKGDKGDIGNTGATGATGEIPNVESYRLISDSYTILQNDIQILNTSNHV